MGWGSKHTNLGNGAFSPVCNYVGGAGFQPRYAGNYGGGYGGYSSDFGDSSSSLWSSYPPVNFAQNSNFIGQNAGCVSRGSDSSSASTGATTSTASTGSAAGSTAGTAGTQSAQPKSNVYDVKCDSIPDNLTVYTTAAIVSDNRWISPHGDKLAELDEKTLRAVDDSNLPESVKKVIKDQIKRGSGNRLHTATTNAYMLAYNLETALANRTPDSTPEQFVAGVFHELHANPGSDNPAYIGYMLEYLNQYCAQNPDLQAALGLKNGQTFVDKFVVNTPQELENATLKIGDSTKNCGQILNQWRSQLALDPYVANAVNLVQSYPTSTSVKDHCKKGPKADDLQLARDYVKLLEEDPSEEIMKAILDNLVDLPDNGKFMFVASYLSEYCSKRHPELLPLMTKSASNRHMRLQIRMEKLASDSATATNEPKSALWWSNLMNETLKKAKEEGESEYLELLKAVNFSEEQIQPVTLGLTTDNMKTVYASIKSILENRHETDGCLKNTQKIYEEITTEVTGFKFVPASDKQRVIAFMIQQVIKGHAKSPEELKNRENCKCNDSLISCYDDNHAGWAANPSVPAAMYNSVVSAEVDQGIAEQNIFGGNRTWTEAVLDAGTFDKVNESAKSSPGFTCLTGSSSKDELDVFSGVPEYTSPKLPLPSKRTSTLEPKKIDVPVLGKKSDASSAS